jgi:hypothetical protein
LDNGTLLIGKAPHIAPQAWLHTIYPPITNIQIQELELKLGNSIPKKYKTFLFNTNGLNVFNTTLNLFGYRSNYNRNVLDAKQPFNILTPNINERPKNADENYFFIGFYDWDGSLIYIDSSTNKVHLSKRDNAKSLYQWNNFQEMIENEIERLIALHEKDGKEKNQEHSTLPIQQK